MYRTEPKTRAAISSSLAATPLIAVLRASQAEDYDAVVDTLVENGLRSIELTLSTPGTIEHLPKLIERVSGVAEIGVGTVTSLGMARAAIDAGADYIVTPIVRRKVIAYCSKQGIAVFPGAFSPTEVYEAWAAGATAVKIFPAETVGPQYAQHLRGPFPELKFVPSGGIGMSNIEQWLAAGASAVSVGGPLLGDALRGGSLTELAARAEEAVAIARAAGSRS